MRKAGTQQTGESVPHARLFQDAPASAAARMSPSRMQRERRRRRLSARFERLTWREYIAYWQARRWLRLSRRVTDPT